MKYHRDALQTPGDTIGGKYRPGRAGCRALRWVLINRFAELTGYSEKAVRCKIDEGVFVQGVHWRKAPDGRIHIDVEAHARWVEGLTRLPTTSDSPAQRSKRR